MITKIYLFFIAAIIGVELSLGILVAPVIFFPSDLIGEGVLSHFQSGQMMTSIFVKFGKILMILSIFSLIFEMVNFNNNKAQSFNLRFSTLMIALINLILALLFVLFFTDYIVEAQKLGAEATKTAEFLQIHNASEWSMKVIVVLQMILFFLKCPKKDA